MVSSLPPLGDEDVVVLGLDMRDAAVGALEHLGADRRIDQVLGARVRRGQQHSSASSQRGRAAVSAQRSAARPDSTPAMPSVSVIARVPIDGIRIERGAERADDAAERRDAVDRAGHAAGAAAPSAAAAGCRTANTCRGTSPERTGSRTRPRGCRLPRRRTPASTNSIRALGERPAAPGYRPSRSARSRRAPRPKDSGPPRCRR